jgi:SET domain-containing protein
MHQAIIFGLGSMFNHSSDGQNVAWKRSLELEIITYTTLRAIEAGEELCISYGSHLWFEDADRAKERKAPLETEHDLLEQIQL